MAPIESFQDHWRPTIHFTAPRGWLNDPCGLIHWNGEFHLFYQHNPAATTWGPMHWGHAVSKDLFRWKDLPLALYPNDERGMAFTGSTVCDIEHSRLAALFTGAIQRSTFTDTIQQQCLATSQDAVTWTEEGVVIPNPGISDFRDPKVVWNGEIGEWHMVLAAGNEIRIYKSPDLTTWRHTGSFGRRMVPQDGVWECPDLFEVPVADRPGRSRWVATIHIGHGLEHEIAGAFYVTGTFDGRTFEPDRPQFVPVDQGHDFYAAQSWANLPARGNRRLWIAWAAHPDYAARTPTESWRGTMTLPRELGLLESGGTLHLTQQPARELAALRERQIAGPAGVVTETPRTDGKQSRLAADAPTAPPRSPTKPPHSQTAPAGTISVRPDRAYEIELPGSVAFAVNLEFGHAGYVRITSDGRYLAIDRSQCDMGEFGRMIDPVKSLPVPADPTGLEEARIIFDRSILECFLFGGRVVTTDLVFPAQPLSAIRFSGAGCSIYQLTKALDRR